jgi:membrane protein
MVTGFRTFVSQSWEVLSNAWKGYSRAQGTHLAAAMAFYTILAVAPLILIATAVGGLVSGPEAARDQLLSQVQVAVGADATGFIDKLLENWQDPGSSWIATVVGTATTLYLAFRVFNALRDMLNTIWGVRISDDISWGRLAVCYMRSGLTMFLVVPLFLISTLLSEVFTRIGPFLELSMGISWDLGMLPFIVTGFLLLSGMFGIIYKWLPDVHIAWRDVWFGAVVTALLFSAGRALIGLYMTYATTASMFGAAGSLVVLMFWIYYSAQIVFFGAEITDAYATEVGGGIEPSSDAVRVSYPNRVLE